MSTDPARSLARAIGSGYGDGTARAWLGRDGRRYDTRGENSRVAKLTELQVREIKRRTGETCRALAVEYGVSAKAISAIRRGASWAHVKSGQEEEAS